MCSPLGLPRTSPQLPQYNLRGRTNWILTLPPSLRIIAPQNPPLAPLRGNVQPQPPPTHVTGDPGEPTMMQDVRRSSIMRAGLPCETEGEHKGSRTISFDEHLPVIASLLPLPLLSLPQIELCVSAFREPGCGTTAYETNRIKDRTSGRLGAGIRQKANADSGEFSSQERGMWCPLPIFDSGRSIDEGSLADGNKGWYLGLLEIQYEHEHTPWHAHNNRGSRGNSRRSCMKPS